MLPSHLHPPRLEDARELVESPAGARATIYIAGPVSPGFTELHEVPRRYRAALEEARRRLDGAERAPDTDAALRGAIDPIELEAADLPRHEWTVASFFGPRFHRLFALPVRARDEVRVGERFALLPLLRAVHLAREFRVLALAENRVRLFEGDAEGLREVQPKGVPRHLTEALGLDLEAEPALRFHPSSRGGDAVIFSGRGGAPDERATDLERFHTVMARAVGRAWSGRDDPLVLVADRSHQGRFQKHARLPGLLERGVEGSPERMEARELHALAWPIVLEEARRADGELGRSLDRLLHAKHLADRREDARRAAERGLVQRLWIAENAPGDDDALEDLVEQVLRTGGEPIVVPPHALHPDTELAAELRAPFDEAAR